MGAIKAINNHHMEEIWKAIKNYSAYMVSNYGRVKSFIIHKDGKLLNTSVANRNGYVGVHLYKDGKKTQFSVHRLVAEAFIPNPKNKPQINHLNGDKTDNRVDNIEWATASENTKHSFANGLQVVLRGENAGSAKLSSHQVRRIKLMLELGTKHVEIAKMFPVQSSQITRIASGERWAHI